MYNRHLDSFISAADCGSFSRAAEKAYISTNALIKHINLLESELGIRLFERTNHGITLTESGKYVYDGAKQIIRLSDQTLTRARNLEHSAHQSIRLASSLMRSADTLIGMLNNPSVSLEKTSFRIVPVTDDPNTWVRIVENFGQDVDIAAGIYPSALWGHKCNVLTLQQVPLCVALPKSHRLAAKSIITFEDLHGETLLMIFRGDTSYIDILRDEIEQHHPDIHLSDQPSYGIETFNQCAVSGNPMISIESWSRIHPDLITIPCDWPYTVPYGIIYSLNPSKQVMKFMEELIP